MEHLVPMLSDPTFRQMVGPAVGDGLKWAIIAARSRFAGSPEPVQQKVEQNADAFAELLAAKVAAKIQGDSTVRETVNEELGTPKGMSDLQRAVEVATEIDDEFTRENLAELVARRLAARGATRLQLATRIATDALVYLTEQQLRLLAFMIFVQGLRPSFVPSNEEEWTNTVLAWLREKGPVLVVTPDDRDLGLLSSAGLVDVMPGILGYDVKEVMKSPQGFVPQVDPFLSTDPLGQRISSAFAKVCHHRLNISGMILGVTISDKITGSTTDVSSF